MWRVVDTLSGPGNIAATTAAEQMAPSISATKATPARTQLIAPIKAKASVTAGLNNPIDNPVLARPYKSAQR